MGRVKELWQALQNAGKTEADFNSRKEELAEAIRLKEQEVEQELIESGYFVKGIDEEGRPYMEYVGEPFNA